MGVWTNTVILRTHTFDACERANEVRREHVREHVRESAGGGARVEIVWGREVIRNGTSSAREISAPTSVDMRTPLFRQLR